MVFCVSVYVTDTQSDIVQNYQKVMYDLQVYHMAYKCRYINRAKE